MYIDDGFQVNIFLFSVGFGMLLAVVYDLFKIVHFSFLKSEKCLIAKDILFCIVSAFMSFLFLLAVNFGRVRLYLIAGAIIGFCCWYLAASTFFVRLCFAVIGKTSSFIAVIAYVFSFPFRVLYRFFGRFLDRKLEFFGKYFKNLKNKSKILLKKK